MEKISIQGTEYCILNLLGKGKGGYSYLDFNGEKKYVLKQIHHEPCSYYTFGNKIDAEKNDYQTLSKTGIRMPKLITIDEKQEIVLKEFIDGPTIYDLIVNDCMKDIYIQQVKEMCKKLYPEGLNIDYFPTNFVVQNNEIYYVDYECNDYMDEWNFENWGINYWSKTEEFLTYM